MRHSQAVSMDISVTPNLFGREVRHTRAIGTGPKWSINMPQHIMSHPPAVILCVCDVGPDRSGSEQPRKARVRGKRREA